VRISIPIMKHIIACCLFVCARGLKINDGHSVPLNKFVCDFNSSDTRDLNEFSNLFKKWSGQTVMLMGDSLMFQTYNVMRCGAGALGWKHDVEEMSVYYQHRETSEGFARRPVAAEHLPFESIEEDMMFQGESAWKNGSEIVQGVLTKSVLRPHGKSSMKDAVVLYMYFFYKVKLDIHDAQMGYREPDALPPAIFQDRIGGKSFFRTKPAAIIDVVSSNSVDHLFTNLGHHALQYGNVLAPEIDHLFRVFNAALVAAEVSSRHKRPAFAILSHPPQHFNNQNGEYQLGKTNEAQPCSNNVPNIRNQLVMKNNQLKLQKAVEYGHGFAFIDFSESMLPYGNLHFPEYGDCTHYQLSAKAWAGAMKAMATA